MLLFEMSQNTIQKFEKLKRSLIIELHKTEIAHEWWFVQAINDNLDFSGAQSGSLGKYFCRSR